MATRTTTATTTTTKEIPDQSALSNLISSSSSSSSSTYLGGAKSKEASSSSSSDSLSIEVLHNLQHQHNWVDLKLHTINLNVTPSANVNVNDNINTTNDPAAVGGGGGGDLQTLGENIRTLNRQLAVVRERTDKAMREPNPRTAAHHIVELIRNTNKFFHNAALWGRVNSTDPDELRLCHYGVYVSAESIRITAILLQPFMPGRMKVALDMMEVEDSKRTFAHARVGADLTFGCPPPAPAPPTSPDDDKKKGKKKARSTVPQLFPMLLSDN
ncbi:methionyl-tRNA synthetase [Exophiala oligosperma]